MGRTNQPEPNVVHMDNAVSQGIMHSMLFFVLCVLSFTSVSFSTLIFSDRYGLLPPGQEELTPTTYTLQMNDPPAQVGLTLGPLKLTVEGENFVAFTFGFQGELIIPGTEGPIQDNGMVLVVLFGENVDRDKVIQHISNIPSLEAALNDVDLSQASIFMFGFKVNIDPSSLADSRFDGFKRRSDWPISSESKRARLANLVLRDPRLYCNYRDTNVEYDTTHVDIVVTVGCRTGAAHVELNGRVLTFMCKGGANILILRNGQVQEGSIMPAKNTFPDFNFNDETLTLCSYHDMTEKIEALYGDVVVLLVPTSIGSDSNNLKTLAGARQLLGNPTDAVAKFDQFSAEFCGDKVVAFMFIVKPRESDDY